LFVCGYIVSLAVFVPSFVTLCPILSQPDFSDFGHFSAFAASFFCPFLSHAHVKIIIIIIILIHYHKGLSAVGLDLPTGSLGLRFPAHHLRAVSYLGCINCAKPSRRISN